MMLRAYDVVPLSRSEYKQAKQRQENKDKCEFNIFRFNVEENALSLTLRATRNRPFSIESK